MMQSNPSTKSDQDHWSRGLLHSLLSVMRTRVSSCGPEDFGPQDGPRTKHKGLRTKNEEPRTTLI